MSSTNHTPVEPFAPRTPGSPNWIRYLPPVGVNRSSNWFRLTVEGGTKLSSRSSVLWSSVEEKLLYTSPVKMVPLLNSSILMWTESLGGPFRSGRSSSRGVTKFSANGVT